uniref:Uncharacterized protein n=1 Tax=Panagrellus redivivus TaxID=6233 RepID=A0A7E4W883_PANRE
MEFSLAIEHCCAGWIERLPSLLELFGATRTEPMAAQGQSIGSCDCAGGVCAMPVARVRGDGWLIPRFSPCYNSLANSQCPPRFRIAMWK